MTVNARFWGRGGTISLGEYRAHIYIYTHIYIYDPGRPSPPMVPPVAWDGGMVLLVPPLWPVVVVWFFWSPPPWPVVVVCWYVGMLVSMYICMYVGR